MTIQTTNNRELKMENNIGDGFHVFCIFVNKVVLPTHNHYLFCFLFLNNFHTYFILPDKRTEFLVVRLKR